TPSTDPNEILQFDRRISSTQLPSIDFPQFTSVDSIDNWTIWRFGVRNRLQTRRDDSTLNWLELDTYFDLNIDNPFDKSRLSNLFNNLTFRPLPWVALRIDSQLPAFDNGFSEVNTTLYFLANRDLQVGVGHRYLSGNPFFQDSDLVTFNA